MTVKEYKEQLKTLHDSIKENPFRRNYKINAKYDKGYFETVYKLAQTFSNLAHSIDLQRQVVISC